MTLGHLQYERDLIAGFRAVHAAIAKRAHRAGILMNVSNMETEEWIDAIGPEAFAVVVAEECDAQGVSAEAFTAWASQPDPDTEILDSMGYFNP